MANISSYPQKQPKPGDLILFSETYDVTAVNPVIGNPTKTTTIQSIVDMASGGGGGTVTSLTVLGTSGDATLLSGVLNIPNYTASGGTSPITIENARSLFSTGFPDTGVGATNADDSNFFGAEAGQDATNASGSNFLGRRAGFQATSASSCNFLGYSAGESAVGSISSNFLGGSAGKAASNSNYSNFIGDNAGQSAYDSDSSNFLGSRAGFNSRSADNSNFIGAYAGYNNIGSPRSICIGSFAGYQQFNAPNNIFIGHRAGDGGFNASGVALGLNNIIIGTNITLPVNALNSINIGGIIYGTGSFYPATINDAPSSVPSTNGKIGIGITTPASKLSIDGGVQIADDLDTASAAKVGTLKYREDANNSYTDMCMKTGAQAYAWVNIVTNTWV